MTRSTIPFQFSAVFLAGLLTLGVGHAAPDASSPALLGAWIPEQSLLCLEIYEPDRLLAPLLSPAFGKRVAALPALQRRPTTKEIQDLAGLTRLLEATAQTNWQQAVRTLTHEGAAWAIGEGNRSLLVLGGADPTLLDKLHSLARTLALSEADKQGQAERVRSSDYAGVTGWTFNGKEAHAIITNHLLAASDAEVLKLALNLRTTSVGSLAQRPEYKAARQAVGKDALGMLFLDLEKLRKWPQFLNALDEQHQNPLAALLLAGMTSSLKGAPWLAIGVYVEAGDLCLRSFVGGEEALDATAAFARPAKPTAGAAALLAVPRQIAALSLYRDLAGFYAAKDQLFPQRTSGLIFFENMMGIFFSGRNLTDEVLAQMQPRIRVVAARQEFDLAVGTPDPQWPAFAVVFELHDPKEFNEVIEEAWQKALGLVNFTRGQKALPGLILDRVQHQDTLLTVARYSAKDAPDRAHLEARFNLRPTLALAHGHAILSSTDQLARDLVDALAKPPRPGAATNKGMHSLVQLRGPELEAILKANRSALVLGNMLKEGKTQSEAGLAIDTLCTLVGWIESARLQVGQGPRHETAELKFTFSQP